MLRLDRENNLVNGNGETVVLRGVGLGGTYYSPERSSNLSRMDEYGELHHRLSVPRIPNPRRTPQSPRPRKIRHIL